MEPGLVSAVLPVHNGARWLRQAIDSVLGQTYPAVEIVTVDDGSTDESFELLSGYGGPVRPYRQKNCGSVGLVRNAAIERSRGEFLAFLDQDDWWLPGKLARQVAMMRSDAQIELVHTAVRHFDDASGDECPPLNPFSRPEQISGDCFEELLLGNPIYNSSVLVRREAVDQVGMCDPANPGNTVQDYDLWLRIAAKCRCGFVAEQLTTYRLHRAQGMRDRRAMLRAELGVLLRIRGEAWWRSDPRGRKRLASLYDDLAVACLEHREWREARRCFQNAWRLDSTARRMVRYGASRLPGPMVNAVRSLKCRFGR